MATEDHPFLSLDEVKELTGAGTRRTVIANLRRNGIRHTIKADGWPAVAWAAVVGSALETKAANSSLTTWSPRKAA